MADLSLIKKTTYLSISNSSKLFVKVLLGIILARIFNEHDYGTYRQLIMLYYSLIAFFMFAIPESILYFLPKLDSSSSSISEKQKFITQNIITITALGLLFSLTLFLLRDYISIKFNNPDLKFYLVVFSIFPFFMSFSEAFSFILLSLKKVEKVVVFSFFSIACDLLLVLLTGIVTKSLKYVVIGISLSSFIQAIFALLIIKQHFIYPFFSLTRLKQQMVFSFPLWISNFIFVLGKQLDKLMISGAFSPEVFAVFAVGATEIPAIGNIRKSVHSIVQPELSTYGFENIKKIYSLYSETVRKLSLIFFPISFFFFVFSKEIITILYSSKYSSASTVFRLYTLTAILRIANYSYILQLADKTKILLYRAVLSLIVNIILNILFLKLFGFIGPSMASVLLAFIDVAVFLAIFKYYLKLDLKALFPIFPLINIFIITLISSVLSSIILFLHFSTFLTVFAGLLVFFSLFITQCFLFNIIKKHEIEYLSKLRKKLMNNVSSFFYK